MNRIHYTSTMHKNGAQSVRRTRQGKEISRRERSRSELRRAHRRCEVKNNSFLRLTQHWRGDPDATADFYASLRYSYIAWVIAVLTFSTPSWAQECVAFGEPTLITSFALPRISESSGLVVSSVSPGILWTHNDSGDEAYVYAANTEGRHIAEVFLPGIEARDWEDIAAGPCGEQTCLYIADMGDNNHVREDLKLVRFVEPSLDPAGTAQSLEIEEYEILEFSYPDGHWDAESLMVHPVTGEIFIVTKELIGASSLYQLSWDSEPQVASLLQQTTLGGLPVVEQATTGADFNADGSRFLVRTYSQIYEFDVTTSVAEAFAAPSRQVDVDNEEQGEAVSYGPDGRSIWTTSEGRPAVVHEYTCLDSLPEPEPDEPELLEEPDLDATSADPSDAPDSSELIEPEDLDTDASDKLPQESEGGCCSQIRRSSRPTQQNPMTALVLVAALLLTWKART